MKNFITSIQVRWSDIDANFHLRHSVYYDWGALSRINFFNQFGFSTVAMQGLHIGPILFREECVFRKEIRLEDKVTIDLRLVKARRDYSRWTIKHTIIKNDDKVSAIITIDGAWFNTIERKLAVPPLEAVNLFKKIPLDEGFQWQD